jgi:hypothetical protein
MRKIYIAFCAAVVCNILFYNTLFGNTVNKTIYINTGKLETFLKISIPYLAFNDSKDFVVNSSIINLQPSQKLVLKVINNDTVAHQFAIKDIDGKATINPKDSIIRTIVFGDELKNYIFFDPSMFPTNVYMGLGGMICISKSKNNKKFFWNLKEHQLEFNNAIGRGKGVDWTNFNPDLFTINGFTFPFNIDDTSANVIANIHDTIHIYIANTGLGIHAIHFHGFHCRVIWASNARLIDTSKDSFPIKSMETMLLEMIPDKIGEYTVHDHNLIATTTLLRHPSGMMQIMKILP